MSAPEDFRPLRLRAATNGASPGPPVRPATRAAVAPGPAPAAAAHARAAQAASSPEDLAELRSLLRRTEEHVDLVRASTAELKAVLPTRVEAAIARALAEVGVTPPSRPSDDGAATLRSLADDLLAERLARAEDAEVLVDLVTAATRQVRADVAGLDRRLRELSDVVAGLAMTVDSLAPVVEAIAAKLDRPLAVTVQARPVPLHNGAEGAGRPVAVASDL